MAPRSAEDAPPDYSVSAEALNSSLAWRIRHGLRRTVSHWQMKRTGFRLSDMPSPILIGATGGSGTRAVAHILQTAGVHMGTRHNFALDAMDFVPFVVRWARIYSTTGESPSGMDADFDAAAFRFRRGIGPHEPWGAKAPRFIYFLPYLAQRLPAMKFIHVVRDGRDMALALNQSQLHDYGDFLLDPVLRSEPEPVRSVALWSRANTEALRFGRQSMADRYLLLRFEDLCRDPRAEVERIFKFIGSDALRDPAVACVREQKTTGRWQSAPPELVQRMSSVAAQALHEFGYE